MQTDELRAELAELAREVDPFSEDLPAIRRRVARRRVAGASVAAVLIVGLIAGAIAITQSGADHVSVAGHPKEMAVEALPRIDALVALPAAATAADAAAVKDILDSAPVVKGYATLPRQAFLSIESGIGPLFSPSERAFARKFARSLVLGVELDRTAADGTKQLASAVGSAATVKDLGGLSRRPTYDDAEIFMTVTACNREIEAVRRAVERDPRVDSFRFLSKNDALAEFKRLFRNEPSLVGNTTASSLPTSFRLRLRDDVQPSAVANHYAHFAGVRSINARANPFANAGFVSGLANHSICAR